MVSNWIRLFVMLVAVSLTVISAPGCKENKEKKAAKKDSKSDDAKGGGKDDHNDEGEGDESGDGTGEPEGTGTGSPDGSSSSGLGSDDCDKPTSSGSGSGSDDEDEEIDSSDQPDSSDEDSGIGIRSAGVFLLDQVTYESDIKPIVEDKCLSCHKQGGTSPDLSTYNKLKSNLSDVIQSIDKKTMPPSSAVPLTKSEKDKIADWEAEGAPESAGSGGTGSSTGSDDGDGTDCDDEDGSDETGDWDELIKPDELKKCHDKGKLYERASMTCHKADLATSFSCTTGGIKEKFASLNVDVQSQLEKFANDGYVIDQCGELSGDILVTFYKKVETPDELRLKIKRLCKGGSPLCQ